MKFGVAYDLRNPRKWLTPFNALYQECVNQTSAVEELGYDSIWVCEHHYSEDDGWIPAGLTLAAAVAARTQRVKIGTYVIALPFHDPVRVAEQVTVLDYISNGRIRLGVAVGYRVQEFKTHGIDRKERGARLEEGIDIIKRCWTEERFSYEGKFNRFTDLAFYPRPVQVPHPPIYVGAQTASAIRRAARLGCHLLPLGSQGTHQVYTDALRENGRDPSQYEFATMYLYSPIVTRDPDATWKTYREQLLYRLDWYDRWYNEAADLPKNQLQLLADASERERRERAAIMTPEQCVAFMTKFLANTPCTEMVLWAGYPGIPLSVSFQWLELFAKEVMPHFRHTVGGYAVNPAKAGERRSTMLASS